MHVHLKFPSTLSEESFIKSLKEPLFPFLVAEQYNLNELSPLQKEFILILTQVQIFFLNIAADISGGWWVDSGSRH